MLTSQMHLSNAMAADSSYITMPQGIIASERVKIYVLKHLHSGNSQVAENQTTGTKDKEDLEYMVRNLKQEYGKWSLGMNMEKT